MYGNGINTSQLNDSFLYLWVSDVFRTYKKGKLVEMA